MEKIHKLCIDIENDAFQRVKTEMGTKIMVGNVEGAPDKFVCLIINAIDKNEEKITIKSKNKGDSNGKKIRR